VKSNHSSFKGEHKWLPGDLNAILQLLYTQVTKSLQETWDSLVKIIANPDGLDLTYGLPTKTDIRNLPAASGILQQSSEKLVFA
jgi:hypothetical protein